MSQPASAEHAAATSKRPSDGDPAGAPSAGFEVVRSAWRRNLQMGADAARAFQAEHAQFAGRLLDLNLQAARTLAAPAASGDRIATPFDLGASAVELYFGYLGRSAALAQQAIILPWKEPQT